MPNPPIPILLICRELGFGGSERQLTEAAIHIDRSQFLVHVAAFRTDGMRSADLTRAGIHIHHVPVRSYRSLYTIRAALLLTRCIRIHHIQLVHTFDLPVIPFVVPVARLSRVPVVLTSTRGDRRDLSRWLHRMVRWSDCAVDGVVVNSEAMRRHVVDDEGVRSERVFLIRNGINLRLFPYTDRRGRQEVVIGTVCLLRPEKDLLTLIRAFARLRAAGVGARLKIVGSGPEHARLLAEVSTLHITGQVEFVPAVSDVALALSSIDIFVLPSGSEPFSNALMEAMASGCCCVASAVGGNLELLQHGVNGYLFGAQRDDELADTLRELVENIDRARAVGRRAAETIAADFSSWRSAQVLARTYDRLLGLKGVTRRAPPDQ